MLLWLIPIFPLAGFLINGLFGRRFPKALVNTFAIGSVLLSFAWALKTIASVDITHAQTEHYFTWIQSGTFVANLDFSIDRLTAVMLMIVTGIGSLIHIYAIGYMSHEGGYYRFFAYLNLFMFFMLTLVLAANYLVLFVGWEGVGLCSYLLIGFYFDKQFATNAGNKAFIVNRIGDFGFSLAMFYIVKQFGSLDFGTVFRQAPTASEAVLTTIGLLLLVGACGKSAQLPLYVWLPDAMAGPTPVSALIHAATMVTAGVYMMARSWPIYIHAPGALDVIAIVGIATAFFAATIGLTQFDIKKVYAYSTVSQLGYMFVGVGCGAFSAGIYHVMTHAFFKALLFLGAGSVIHGLHGEQDLRRMGGLRKKLPWTHATILCASLAIAGFPFTSGFFSKDAILLAAAHEHMWIYWVGVLTAGMTAFYVFRAFYMTFYGPYKGDAHPHESPPVMYVPLVILALLSLGGGFLFKIPEFLGTVFPTVKELPEDAGLMAFATGAGLLGILLAHLMYVAKPQLPESIASSLGGLYKLVYNKYFVDEIYDATIVKPVVNGSRVVLWRGADAGLIDGIVNGVGATARKVGGGLRLMQSGNIRSYATWVLLGGVAVIVALGVAGGIR
jgi:NADH-quinone oxidoreductase subunit L